ncbi:hypothetical protein EMIT051CA3_30932 [Pseudomonas chlororaphis]
MHKRTLDHKSNCPPCPEMRSYADQAWLVASVEVAKNCEDSDMAILAMSDLGHNVNRPLLLAAMPSIWCCRFWRRVNGA